MIKLIVLGTGTAAPSARRTAAAYWVETGPVKLLLDCGAGTTHRLGQFVAQWAAVTHVAISHFHQDHWGELPALFFALRHGTLPPRTDPLILIGPAGLQNRLTLLAAAYGDWVLGAGFTLDIREIAPGDSVRLGRDITLESCKTPHTPESRAYAVRSGAARLVYTADTGVSESLATWARDCDLMVAECSLPDGQGIEIHLTPTQAGELAKQARARRLVLSHFYPQVEGTEPAAVAARAFGGGVTAASDGDQFETGK